MSAATNAADEASQPARVELKIGDDSFVCRPELTPYVVLRFTRAQGKAAKAQHLAERVGKEASTDVFTEALGATFDLALSVVEPEERQRLEDVFVESELDIVELSEAIGKMFTDYRIAAESQAQSDIPTGRPQAPGPARVVSLSPAGRR